MKVTNKQEARKRRHFRIRKKVSGTADRPRMCVCMSRRNFYVQFVDDEAACTLAQVSTAAKEFSEKKANRETARIVGKLAGERAREKGITNIVFDRGGFKYGTRMRALADAAREAGLTF